VTITNNCGIAMGIPHPMCIYMAAADKKPVIKILRWDKLLNSPTIEVIKGTPLIIKDENFMGVAITMTGNNEQIYTDGSQFYVYNITEDCDITTMS
jgi:hypothetical protein